MKLFIDTANLDAIRRVADLGLLDGVTTNPTLVSREKMPADKLYDEIAKICEGPVNVEAVSQDADGIVEEARAFHKRAPNFVTKIPCFEPGLKAVRQLAEEGIPTNVTLVFSPSQGLLIAKAGAKFVSPFIGRLDDISHTGMDLIEDLVMIYENYDFDTEVVVASVRHPLHVLEAARIGADIVTIPPDVIDKLLKHPLTDIGMKKFLDDYAKIPKG
ncbi:MAG: fructose-6-phosphate aldolase [Candidatus Coatesbacteria bacterium]|nr:MAG: fructose-6-phosphate aldolase [Candidatus Coatesbacteria bacterium]